ncbi:carboxymuconolactone decarboxylase family protein [Saccharothrix lopnurensis]|uniref:Carboxymuconolactone decarboxylase family protein n=1 Tax=Saccharothrix lopnurensis TaxID=1670621 RepID=A0ABW1P5Q8_9PSEU
MRMNFAAVAPEAYRLMIELNSYATRHVDHTLLELVKLRASVLNGCAFCVDMHTSDAVRAGENPQRLFAVSVWRESGFFSETERVALELTDAVTRLGEHGVPAELWERAAGAFTEKELADLLALIIGINGLNRLAVALESATERELRP